MQLPIFVINLARHPQRYAFMEAQLLALGLTPERLEAANGADPKVRAAAAVASYAPLSDGEVGCFESHRAIWRQVVDRDLPGAFVLEDDVAVASDFGDLAFDAALMESCDLIKLDLWHGTRTWYGTATRPAPGNRHLQRLLGSEYSSGGYFVTRGGAARLLRASKGYLIPVDRFMFDQQSKTFWEMEVWKLAPAAVAQLRFLEPEIEPLAVPNHQLVPFWDSLRIKLRRLVDFDTRSIRIARIQENMTAFRAVQPVAQMETPFDSPNWDHIDRARALLLQDEAA